ncbi:hypothetical protein DQM24_09875 [Lacticaseibacillus paracasei]|nr:hypothetical protein DQM24_09875 [Lacticaseibacillus paracasei]
MMLRYLFTKVSVHFLLADSCFARKRARSRRNLRVRTLNLNGKVRPFRFWPLTRRFLIAPARALQKYPSTCLGI